MSVDCGSIKGSKYKWGVVILHYQTLELTRQCIDSVIETDNNVNIVVVDNGSANGSGDIIKKEYEQYDNINIISSDKNIGFSRGNNLGYEFLKKSKCEFIVLLNNDTILRQKDFFRKIEADYEETKFDIMGPMVLDKYGNISTKYPQKMLHRSVKSIYIGQIMCLIKWLLSFLNADEKLADMLLNRQVGSSRLDVHERNEYVQISGCCIIFSQGYINKYDGLNPRPFLYLEEEILLAAAERNSLKMVYNPEIQIVHIGEGATESVRKHDAARRRFRYINQFKSFKVLKSEIKGNN